MANGNTSHPRNKTQTELSLLRELVELRISALEKRQSEDRNTLGTLLNDSINRTAVEIQSLKVDLTAADLRIASRIDEKFKELKDALAEQRNNLKEDFDRYIKNHAEETERAFEAHVSGTESVHKHVDKWQTDHEATHTAENTRFYVAVTILATLIAGAFVLVRVDPQYLTESMIWTGIVVYACYMSLQSLSVGKRWWKNRQIKTEVQT
jgi:hypothetical protein